MLTIFTIRFYFSDLHLILITLLGEGGVIFNPISKISRKFSELTLSLTIHRKVYYQKGSAFMDFSSEIPDHISTVISIFNILELARVPIFETTILLRPSQNVQLEYV